LSSRVRDLSLLASSRNHRSCADRRRAGYARGDCDRGDAAGPASAWARRHFPRPKESPRL